MTKVTHQNCPICTSTLLEVAFDGQDYSHSGESFSVYKCTTCDFHFTQDAPDAKSIGPYYQSDDYVSHSDKQEGLFFKVYHWVRNYMLKQKRKMIAIPKGNLLDIGCGTGYFLNEMKTHGWSVDGIEQDERARKYGAEKFQLSVKDITAMDQLKEQHYDAITLWHVLEHVHELHPYLRQIKKALKPSGELLVAVPNRTSYDAKKYGKYWAAWDLPIHLWHFSPQNIADLVAQHGMKVKRHYPLPFDAFYVSLLSEKYKRGNALKGLMVGSWSWLRSIGNPRKCSSVVYVIQR